MKKIFIIVIFVSCCILFTLGYFIGSYNTSNHMYDTNKFALNGCITDSMTAIRVAQAIMLPHFGSELFDYKFNAHTINDSIWFVYGFPNSNNSFGGDFSMKIQKQNCKILQISMGK